ncbi:MAG: pyridoxamine 5'-phosphate oxidase [Anaerolineales bacterium]
MAKLTRQLLLENPIDQYIKWQKDAFEAGGHKLSSMALATTGLEGMPSIRTVLLKEVTKVGFVFYSNYNSEKGRQIQENPKASILFYWESLERQVRVSGAAEKLTASESDEYFQSRPRGAQVGAIASPQSDRIENRAELEVRYRSIAEKYEGVSVKRPKNWGGYRLLPESFEFWQGRSDRLHDRFRYYLDGAGIWVIERLAP